MGVLTTGEIAELRALTVALGFADTCEVLARTRVRDGGEWTETEAVVAAMPCRLRTTGYSPTEREAASKIEGGVVYAVDLPYGTDLDKSAAIRVNGSRLLEVAGPLIDAGNMAMVSTAMAVERG